jgi:hypothetical protein
MREVFVPVLRDGERHADPKVPDGVQDPQRLAHVGEGVGRTEAGAEAGGRKKRLSELGKI